MNAISKALIFFSSILIVVGSYSGVISSISKDSMFSIEHLFVYVELFFFGFLFVMVVNESRYVTDTSIFLLFIFAIDFISDEINGTPLKMLLGLGPNYMRVVEVEGVCEIIARYHAVLVCATSLIAALVIDKFYKSHNKSSHSAS